MRLRFFILSATAAASLFLGVSACRREAKPSSPAPAVPVAQPPAPALVAAAADRVKAERDWQAANPEAAAASKRLSDAAGDYALAVAKFGLYAEPAQVRDAALAALAVANEKGDRAAALKAQQDLAGAEARVQEAEAKLRLGNPSLQKLYDDWMEALRAYKALRDRDPGISQAERRLTQRVEEGKPLEKDANDRAKEN